MLRFAYSRTFAYFRGSAAARQRVIGVLARVHARQGTPVHTHDGPRAFLTPRIGSEVVWSVYEIFSGAVVTLAQTDGGGGQKDAELALSGPRAYPLSFTTFKVGVGGRIGALVSGNKMARQKALSCNDRT